MLQCKVDYLAIHGRNEHAIALFFWEEDAKDKESDAVHVALDANLFKEGTYHQIADALEIAINACFEKIGYREKTHGREKVDSESN